MDHQKPNLRLVHSADTAPSVDSYKADLAPCNKISIPHGLKAAWTRAHEYLSDRTENALLPYALRELWVPVVNVYCSEFRKFLILQAQGMPSYSGYICALANKPIHDKIFKGLSPFRAIVQDPTAETLMFAKAAVLSELPGSVVHPAHRIHR